MAFTGFYRAMLPDGGCSLDYRKKCYKIMRYGFAYRQEDDKVTGCGFTYRQKDDKVMGCGFT